ncbi:MAG: dipeptidase [Anaerolineae bacterium]|nr:dipeptidase [Anaerolineae bacterium]
MSTINQYPVIDGHNDSLMYFSPPTNALISSFFERLDGRQVDLPRIREGGMAAGFFAVFISEEEAMNMVHNFDPNVEYVLPALNFDAAQKASTQMVANLFRIETASNGQVKVVRTVADLEACLRDGVIGAVLHFEGAEQIDAHLDALEVYYQAGLRSMGIVWSRPTIFAHGVPFKFPHSPDTGPGLTDVGKELVRACNRLGIMIDLSHLNEKGFWDVAKISDVPLVATHSNAHALCQLPRNLTDKQLAAIKESDGIVGVNLVTMLLREDARDDSDTPIETVLRHMDYLVNHLGIDRVGIGADYGDAPFPKDLPDVSSYPVLITALQKAGYDDESLRKITHENWLRVLRKTWKS